MSDKTRKRLEKENRRQHALTRALLDSLSVGVCIIDDSGCVQTLNPVGHRILGWSESHIRGQSCHGVFDCLVEPSDEGAPYCPIDSVLQTQAMAWTPRTRLRCRNEEWKWVELSATGLKEYGLTGVLLTFRDLTSEMQFADDYRRLASIPEESPFPIVEVDSAANLQYANAAMATLMEGAGLCPEGFSAAFPFNFPKLIDRCLTQGTIQRDVEVNVGQRQFAWLFSPHKDLGLVRGYGIDVTDRKRAADELAAFADTLEVKNRELDQALNKAEAATRTKAAFLATMSHEIRTPLNGIIGMTQILVDSSLSRDQSECVEVVRSSAEALLMIINDILDFSKIEAGKLKLENIPFSISNLVEEVLDLFAERAQRKGLDLAGIIRSNVPLTLRGDPNRLRQILTNFVGNAIKFTDLGEVTIEIDTIEEVKGKDLEIDGMPIERDSRKYRSPASSFHYVLLRFCVRDTGIGISPDVQPRLFQAFSQADVSTTRKYGGTGLGLAISRQLTELMDGQIGIESEPGVGTTFWCTIPFEVHIPGAVDLQVNNYDFSKYRVLILGCPPATRAMLEECLCAGGAVWASTSECSQAREWLQEAAVAERPYHVVILDTLLPERTRAEFNQWVRAHSRLSQLKILLLTPFGSSSDSNMLKQNGIAATLTKPIRRAQLAMLIPSLERTTDTGLSECLESNRSIMLSHKSVVPSESSSLKGGDGPIILVAEDNPVNQRVAVRILEKLGCRVLMVSDGRQAVEVAVNRPIDLVFMDWQMPEMDGLQATQAIRNAEQSNRSGRFARIAIIGMTANAMEGDREQCIEAGMDDYVTKPIRDYTIKKILRRWLPARVGDRLKDSDLMYEQNVSVAPILESAEKNAPLGLSSTQTLNRDENTHYDVQAALEAVGGDWELLRSLIALFLNSCPKMIAQICEAYKSRNLDLLGKAVHQLKGALSTLHAVSAATAARRLEQVISSEGWEVLSKAYDDFDQYMKLLIHDLETVIEHKESSDELRPS